MCWNVEQIDKLQKRWENIDKIGLTVQLHFTDSREESVIFLLGKTP